MAKIQIKPLRSKTTEGYRVLVLPEWPKGLKRSSIDCWAKDLAPAPELLKHRSCGLSAAAFDYVYRNGLSKPCMRICFFLFDRLFGTLSTEHKPFNHDGLRAAMKRYSYIFPQAAALAGPAAG